MMASQSTVFSDDIIAGQSCTDGAETSALISTDIEHGKNIVLEFHEANTANFFCLPNDILLVIFAVLFFKRFNTSFRINVYIYIYICVCVCLCVCVCVFIQL